MMDHKICFYGVKWLIIPRLSFLWYSFSSGAWNDDAKYCTVNSLYLKVRVHPKLLITQSIFSGLRKFTLRYQWLELKGAEI